MVINGEVREDLEMTGIFQEYVNTKINKTDLETLKEMKERFGWVIGRKYSWGEFFINMSLLAFIHLEWVKKPVEVLRIGRRVFSVSCPKCQSSNGLTGTAIIWWLSCSQCGESFIVVSQIQNDRDLQARSGINGSSYVPTANGLKGPRSVTKETRRHWKQVGCYICGTVVKIEIHHISGNGLDNSNENLIGLCRKHHHEITRRCFRTRAQVDRYRAEIKYKTKLTGKPVNWRFKSKANL